MSGLKIKRVTDPLEIGTVQMIDATCFPEEPWKQTFFSSILGSHTEKIYILFCDVLPCGYAVMQVVAGEGEIERIGILPECRNKELGEKLLCGVLTDLELDLCALEVSEKNMPAICLYKKCGFEQVGLRKNYYPDGSDAWIMIWKRENNEDK